MYIYIYIYLSYKYIWTVQNAERCGNGAAAMLKMATQSTPPIDRHYIRSCACYSRSGGSGGGVCPALSRAPEMFSSLLPLLRACAHTHARARLATLTCLRPGWTLRNLMNLTLDLAIINPRFIIKLSL